MDVHDIRYQQSKLFLGLGFSFHHKSFYKFFILIIYIDMLKKQNAIDVIRERTDAREGDPFGWPGSGV